MQPLSKDLPLPLYHQLKQLILNGILAGQWKPDEQLPTESALAEQFGVSKITVRQALRDLAELGYVRREQGRGTFVRKPQLEQGPRELTSFSDEMVRRGFAAASEVLEQELVNPPATAASKLDLSEKDLVFRLKRLRLADGEPMGIQTAFIPLALVPQIDQVSFARSSLYDVLHSRYGLYPVNAKETHSAVLVDGADAALLGVAPGSPAMAAERVTYLSGQRPLEYVQSIMRGDRYKIVLDLVKEP